MTTHDTTLTAVDESTFESEVLQVDMPVLVDFWATWCPPCYPMARVLEQVAAQRAGALRVVQVNADENPAVVARYRVRAMPTMMLFAAGEPTWSVVGARSKARIDAELDSALADLGPVRTT